MPAVRVLDSTIYYEDTGDGTGDGAAGGGVAGGTGSAGGPPFVLLHGNPGSSYLWRKVLPALGPGRVLAPDLIGMGRSGKPDIPYAFADHARYLDAWFEALGLDEVVLVGHDWGGALAFDRAARHPGQVRGLAFLESIVGPMAREDLSAPARERSDRFRTPGLGEQLVLEQDLFVRQAYTGGVLTPVAPEDLAVHLAPFPTPESRRPVLAWARQLPLDGEPAELVARLKSFGPWLADSESVPKLLMAFTGSPTLLIDAPMARWCAAHMASLETVACGSAGHHAPEDRPGEIAAALASWAARHGLRAGTGGR